MLEKLDFSGKTIVVAGGGGLIGTAIARQLLALNARVICADISCGEEDCIEFYPLDLAKVESCQEEVEKIWAEKGPINGWINAAFPRSPGWTKSIASITEQDWEDNVDWHMNKYCMLTLKLCEKMRQESLQGSVVNISSIFGTVAHKMGIYKDLECFPAIPYAAIKGGISAFSNFCASCFGEFGIRVNVVSPGAVKSDRVDPVVEQRMEKEILLQRLAESDEIACAAVFLLSDAASYITGTNLHVDGGWTTT